MIYTYQQLQKISAERQAADGRLYNCDDGKVYVGNSSGRLELDTRAVNVIINRNEVQVNLQKVSEEPKVQQKKDSGLSSSMLLMGG